MAPAAQDADHGHPPPPGLKPKRRPIAVSLIVSIVLFSSLITLVLTAIQLFIEYGRDVTDIEQRFTLIKSGYLEAVQENVWVLDKERLDILLAGIIEQPDFSMAEVRLPDGGTLARQGKPAPGDEILRSFPLTHGLRGRAVPIGSLIVTASLEGIYQRTIERVLYILGANALKTAAVAFFIYLLVWSLVTRHLNGLSAQARDWGARDMDGRFQLDHRNAADTGNEFDDLVEAMNAMQGSLARSYRQLADLNAHLEERVAEQTHNIKAQEARFRDIALSTSDRLWETDADHRFIWLHQPEHATTKLPIEKFLGQTRWDIVGGDTAQDQEWRALATTLAERRPFKGFEYAIPTGDGATIIQSVSGVPVFDAAGNFTGYRGAATDVTERRKIETILRENNERFRRLLESALVGIITIDAGGTIQSANPVIESMFGYAAEDMVGRNVKMLMGKHDHGHHDQYLKNYLDTGETKVVGKGREVMARRKDGSLFPIMLGVSLLKLDENSYFSGIIRDISAEKAAEQRLIADKEAADRASRAKSEFLSRVSHELRTPLNSILGFSELLRTDQRQDLNDQQLRMVGFINNSGHHLLDLINDVLDLTRVETGRLGFENVPVNLDLLFKECLVHISALAEQAGVSIAAAPPPLPVPAWADRTRLRQVLLNLLTNAVKYNRPGGSLAITHRMQGKTTLCITVTDTGIGIPADHMDRLFQPFDRLGAEKTDVEGAGIGLALVKQLVEAMGGNIQVESAPGEGSAFSFTVPLATDLEAVAAADDEPPVATPPAGGPAAAGKTVLYIEDDPNSVSLMAMVVARLPGVALRAAVDAESGLKMIDQQAPDLIVMDINLPGMNGVEALAKIRARTELAHIPVVALSADILAAPYADANKVGFDEVISKPLKVSRLRALLVELLA